MLIVAIYIDDGLIFSTSTALMDDCIADLKRKFEITSGEKKTCVGSQIEQSAAGLRLHQSDYIRKIIARFGLEYASLQFSKESLVRAVKSGSKENVTSVICIFSAN